jgi:hypothetical protein
MYRLRAGEALGLGFDHRSKVVAALGALLLQLEPDRGQVIVADRLRELYGTVVICTERMLDGVTWQIESSWRAMWPASAAWRRGVGRTLAIWRRSSVRGLSGSENCPVSCFLFPGSCFLFPVSVSRIRIPYPVSRIPFPVSRVRGVYTRSGLFCRDAQFRCRLRIIWIVRPRLRLRTS